MLKPLLSVRLTSLINWITGANTSKYKKSKTSMFAFSFMFLYILISYGAMVGTYFASVKTMIGKDYPWLYFSLGAVMAFGLTFFMSIFTVSSQLYNSKDNDLLLSMPITPSAIIFSRLAFLLVFNYIFCLPVIIPVWILWQNSSIAFSYFICFLLIPFLSLTTSALVGYFVNKLTKKVKKRTFVSTVLSFAFFGGYMLLAIKMNSNPDLLGEFALKISDKISANSLLYLFGSIIANNNIIGTAVYALIIFALTGLVYFILSKSFIAIATTKNNASYQKYVSKDERTLATDTALIMREFERLGSCSPYIVNAGFGAAACILGSVLIPFKTDAIIELLNSKVGIGDMMNAFVVIIPAVMATMHTFSAASISIDGKTLWILRSLPVSTEKILMSKVKEHIMIALPVQSLLVLSISISFNTGFLVCLSAILVSAAMTVFVALIGLIENLKNPMLDWVSETQAVKNGIGVIATVLIGWVSASVPSAVAVATVNTTFFVPSLLILSLVIFGVCAWLRKWIKTKGVEIYENL